jgi:hypothetical protein
MSRVAPAKRSYAARVQKMISDASALTPGWSHAVLGLLAASVGGLFIAQAGGSDRETFLSIGFLLGAVGLLEIVIGGVAIGMRLAQESAPAPLTRSD